MTSMATVALPPQAPATSASLAAASAIDIPESTTKAKHDGAITKKRRRRAVGGGAQDDCFSCRKRAVQCDRKRPYCSQCISIGKDCSGYKTTLTWGVGVASRGKLRGMSLPVASVDNEKMTGSGPSPTARRPSSISRLRHDIVSEAGPRSRAKRSDRRSFTSNPITIQPALAQASMHSDLGVMSSPWYSPTSSTSSMLPSSVSLSRSLQRLQTSLGPFSEDYAYSDSASSTGSFFDTDFHTPTEYIPGLIDLDTFPDMSTRFRESPLPVENASNSAISRTGADHIPPLLSTSDTSLDDVQYASQGPDRLSQAAEKTTGHDELSNEVMSGPFTQFSFHNPFSSMMPRMQYLIQYYATNICPFLVALDGPQNPYRDHILQLALQNDGLQHALAALATNNMRMRKAFGQPGAPHEVKLDLSVESLPDAEENMYKQISVQRLNQQLADPLAAQDDSVLATLLVLCLFHVCDSGFSKFRTQLAGVQKLLSMRHTHQRSTFTDWVEMFFMWFDVMTSAVNDREIEITGERFDMLEYSANLGSLEQFSGCDGRLFKLIARLGRLNLLAQGRPVHRGTAADAAQPAGIQQPLQKRPANRSLDARDYNHLDGNGWGSPIHAPPQSMKIPLVDRPAPDARSEFWAEWHDIRAHLQDWHVDLSSVASFSIDSGRMGSEQGDMAHISESFRHAALIYTERLAHPLLPSAAQQIQQHVIKALLHITALSVTSCVNKFLLWPLFIAGTECVDAGHRAVVRSRCIEIQRESGFYNNLSCLEVLERVWSDVDVGHSDAGEMKARRRDSERVGAGPQRQAFRWRIAMDRVDGEYLII